MSFFVNRFLKGKWFAKSNSILSNKKKVMLVLASLRKYMKAGGLKKVSKDENLLIIAGEEDPVGRFGKGPRELHWMYQKLGVKKVKLKMFDHMRHEIHNETGKEAVWTLISKFLLA